MGPDEILKALSNRKDADARNAKLKENSMPSSIAKHRMNTLQQQLSDDEKAFIQYMAERLPPVIGRSQVERYLPGLIKPQTLAQADCAGLGPEVAWKVGRKIAYRTDSLLLWLVGRCGIVRIVDIRNF
jgi:hypothetical protein